MDAILACLEEIALEGLDGCPLKYLWTLLEKRRPPLPIAVLDDFSKAFLWKGVVQSGQVEFCVVPKPSPHIFDTQFRERVEKELELKEPLDKVDGLDAVIHEYEPVSDAENKIRGSCVTYFIRENVTNHVKSKHGDCLLTCDEAYQRWGDCLVLVASQALRERTLLGVDADPYLAVFDTPYCILEHIGQARHRGRLQRLLSSQFLHLDSKVVFHHLKALIKYGLITRQGISLLRSDHKSYSTNLLHLKKFHTQQYDSYDRLASDICRVLSMAPGKQMVYGELKEQFNSVGLKKFRQVQQFLRQTSYIDMDTPNQRRRKTASKKKKTEGDMEAAHQVTLLKQYVCRPNTDSVIGGDEDSDEDEDQDEIEERDMNLVAEYPWLKQAYDIIESKGGPGVSLSEYHKFSGLPYLECRSLITILCREKYVQPILQHCGKQRIGRYVALPHMDTNIQALKMKKEQKKLEEMRQRLPGTNSPMSTQADAPALSPCSSPAPSLQSVDLESVSTDTKQFPQQKGNKGKLNLAKQVTYRKLKRRTFIVEYLKEVKIVEGKSKIYRELLADEEQEGLSGKLDRKSLESLVCGLKNEGLIKSFKTVVQNDELSQSIEFFLHSSIEISDPAVQVALDQCRFKQATQASKLKQKLKKDKEKVDKEKQKQEKEKEKQEKKRLETATSKTEQTGKAKNPDVDKSDYNKYGCLPKYGRARVLHKLLWQLVYGELSQNGQRDTDPNGNTTSTTASSIAPEKEIPEDNAMGTVEKPAIQRELEIPISRVLDPYYHTETEDDYFFCGLPPLPMYEYPRGHFRIGDVLSVLPLSVYCKLVYCNTATIDIDEYALDPDKKRTRVCDLPHDVHKELANKTRHTQAIIDLFGVIAQMGLVTVLHASPANRQQTVLHLSEGATILDTTSSVTHYNTVEPQSGQPFPSRRYVFSTFSVVKSYWSDLQCIALNTPLGIVYNKRNHNRMIRKGIKVDGFGGPKITESTIGSPPGDGLGAAGLDKLMYVHLRRNWVRLQEPPPWRLKAASKSNNRPKITNVDQTASSASEPGHKRNVPMNITESSKDGDKEKKSLKRGKQKEKSDGDGSPSKKKKARDKGEPASTTQKEQERTKTKMYDDEDARALARRQSQRAIFTADEDSLLLVCKIALTLMKKEGVTSQTSVEIRKVMHSSFESSKDKTSQSLGERVRRLQKNPETMFNLKVLSAEYTTDEEFKDVADRGLPFAETFHYVVKTLREKLSASDTCNTGEPALESSLKSLHDKYTVQTLVLKKPLLSDKDVFQIGCPVTTARDVRKEVIRDLMQVAFTTPPEKYDAYRVFKMFDDFNTEDLDCVFKDMQKKNVINRRRDNMSFLNYYRSIPFASMTYHLSTGYYRVFLRGFTPVTTYKECRTFMKQLLKGEKHRLKDPTDDSSVETDEPNSADYGKEIFTSGTPGSIVINWRETVGGHVACILALMATEKLSVETKIPDEILDMDAPDGAEVEERDDKGSPPRKRPCPSAQAENGPKAKDNAPLEKRGSVTESSEQLTSPGKKQGTTGGVNVDGCVGQTTANELSSSKTSTRRDADVGEETTVLTGISRDSNEEAAANDPSRQSKKRKRTLSQTSDAHCSSGAGSTTSSTRQPANKRSLGVRARRESRSLVTRQREVHHFSFPLCNLSSTFTSEHDLKSVGKTCSFLESKTDSWQTWTRTLAIPVASLQASALRKTSNRASRTALMLKRGVADPTKSVEQLPTRAFNSHDFLFLNPCINTLKLVATRGPGAHKDSDVATAMVSMDTETCDVGTSRPPPMGAYGHLMSADGVIDTSGSLPGTTPISVPESVLSLEEFVDKCRNDLGYNEADLSLARFIHDHVLQQKTLGAPWTLLQEKFIHNQRAFQEATLSLDDHVIRLCAAQLMFRVGVYEPCLVCHQFVKPWCLTLLQAVVAIPESKTKKHQEPTDNTTIASEQLCVTGADTASDGVTDVPVVSDADVESPLDVTAKQSSAASVITGSYYVDVISERGENVEQHDNTNSAGLMDSVVHIVAPVEAIATTEIKESCGIADQATAESVKQVMGPSNVEVLCADSFPSMPKVKDHTKKRALEKFNIICRPWVTTDGDINEKVLNMYEEAMITYILENPGIAHSKVAEHFIDAIRPVSLMTILQTLEQKGCITKILRRMPAKCSVFSKPFTVAGDSITFYVPTVDCIVKLATGDL